MKKTTQFFTDDYLAHCSKMSVDQILNFLEDYRNLQFDPGDLKQVNIRLPEKTLEVFRARAEREGVPYQQKIRELVTNWALELD